MSTVPAGPLEGILAPWPARRSCQWRICHSWTPFAASETPSGGLHGQIWISWTIIFCHSQSSSLYLSLSFMNCFFLISLPFHPNFWLSSLSRHSLLFLSPALSLCFFHLSLSCKIALVTWSVSSPGGCACRVFKVLLVLLLLGQDWLPPPTTMLLCHRVPIFSFSKRNLSLGRKIKTLVIWKFGFLFDCFSNCKEFSYQIWK